MATIRELVTILRYKLDPTGASDYVKKGTAAAKQVESAANRTSIALARMAGVLAATFSVRALGQYAAIWNELNDRVELMTASGEEAAAVMRELQAIARRSRAPIEQVSESWLENVRSLKDMGATTQESLQFVEALNAGLDLSAIRGQRAASVTMALSRAIDRGALRGENLNTVIQNGGMLTEAIAAEMGVAVSELYDLGMANKITADIIKRSMINRLDEWRVKIGEGTISFRDGMDNVRNSLIAFVGNADRSYAVSERLGKMLLWVGDNIQTVVVAAGLVLAAFSFGKIAAGLNLMVAGIAAVRAGWLAAAVAATAANWPIAAAAAVAAGIALLVQDIVTWLNDGDSVIGRLVGSAREWGKWLSPIASRFGRIIGHVNDLAVMLADAVVSVANFIIPIGKVEGGFHSVADVVEVAFGGALTMINGMLTAIDAILTGMVATVKWLIDGVSDVGNLLVDNMITRGVSKGVNWGADMLGFGGGGNTTNNSSNTNNVNVQMTVTGSNATEIAKKSASEIRSAAWGLPPAEAAP